ncbi:MAG: hypothetical protein E7417_00995 [Ruminococcaceae bacterium]|nr:hypothetical protein [Oscillospiraceae bacterium]
MKKAILILLMLSMSLCAYAESSIYESYVRDAFENNIIAGNENGDFESEKLASRAEFIMMTTKFFDLSPGKAQFSDVNETDWFYDSMTLAGANGIISGYGDGTARPYGLITCQEAVSILGRYYKMTEDGPPVPGLMEYARKHYSYAVKNKLFVDMSQKYTDPEHYMTKGELLALLYKYHNENKTKIRFISGYPKLADKGLFNSISISVMTNRPCNVYYSISTSSGKSFVANEPLCRIPFANTEVVKDIKLNMNEKYDITLRAVADSGEAGKVSVLKSISPFSFTKGDGSKENPYIVYTEGQLDQMRHRPSKAYKLENDIKVTGKWDAIDGFSGTLDGDGHKISGIVISGEGENKGLFSSIESGIVKNLTVSADISGKRNIGIIAGHIKNSTIENCVVEGFVSAKTNCTGGICGVNEGTIKNCVAVLYSTASSSFAGGICGQNFGEIYGCLVATEIVAADMYAGGISGTNQGGKIKNCVFAGKSVYDTMTHSSGRITTNRHDAITTNNYCYSDAATNSESQASDKNSKDGMNAEFSELVTMEFYTKNLGWNAEDWSFTQSGFRFPCPSKTSAPNPEAGKMMCFPIEIRNATDLKGIDKNPKAHYIIGCDIYLSGSWKSLCKTEGFSGSLDGNGKTIHNLILNDQDGLFSNISGGLVRNLIIKDAESKPVSNGAILSGCNYGYIEHCTVSGNIKTKKAGSIGIITLENYGEISDCTAEGILTTDNDNATVGGICAYNSGIIKNSLFSGTINANGQNIAAGGISGCDDGGYLFENHADIKVFSKNEGAYIGGICGTAIGSQLYKNSTWCKLNAECKDYMYAGGVCGSLQNALIYNCYSTGELYAKSYEGYIGGLAGCISESNIQSSYSTENIFSSGSESVYTGGICGYSEESFVMQNVALNPIINGTQKTGAVYGGHSLSELGDNYSIDKMLINSEKIKSKDENCIIKSGQVMQDISFFFKPLSQGGLLGWANTQNSDDVWTAANTKYPYPVLTGVKRQDTVKAPAYR